MLRLGRLWGEQLHKVVWNQSCLVTLTNLEEGGGGEGMEEGMEEGGREGRGWREGDRMEREREGQTENHW